MSWAVAPWPAIVGATVLGPAMPSLHATHGPVTTWAALAKGPAARGGLSHQEREGAEEEG